MRKLTAEQQFLLDNPALFLLHYFDDQVEKLEPFHLRLIESAAAKTQALILYPAGHGKTTLVSTLLPIWGLCCDPNIRITLIAKNSTEAENIGRALLTELSENDELIRDFGPFKPSEDTKAWALTRMTIEGRTRRAKEPTISLFGAGAKTALGHRSDWTICDDIVTNESCATPEQRSKQRAWFNQSVRTMVRTPDSRYTVVGTRFHPEDLYGDLKEMVYPDTNEPIWSVQEEDAIVDEDEQIALWPEFRPWRWLMQMKSELGTLDFNKRYRNIAVDPSAMVFKECYVRGGYSEDGKVSYPGCLDKSYSIGEYENDWHRYAGFDPAVGLTRKAKFCAHLSIALGTCAEHEKCLWVLDCVRDQMTLPQQVELIIRQHKEYDLLTSYVEANSYQGGLYQAIQQRMSDLGLALRVEPHYTSRTNKPDPETGVMAMSPWFERGWVHIPWGSAESRRKMQTFVDELVQYPGRTTDTVMAFWFAWRAIQSAGPKFSSFSTLSRSRDPWKRSLGRHQVLNPYFVKEEPVADHA